MSERLDELKKTRSLLNEAYNNAVLSRSWATSDGVNSRKVENRSPMEIREEIARIDKEILAEENGGARKAFKIGVSYNV